MNTITLNVKKASYIEKTVGLIGKQKPYPLYFKTRFGIHTFGVRFPIDVVILNKQNKVVAIKHNLKPNRIFFWYPVFENVLELPAGTLKEKRIILGSTLILSYY